MDVDIALDTLIWRDVPARAIAIAEKCAGQVGEIRKAIEELPTDGFLSLWLNHKEDKILFDGGDWMVNDDWKAWSEALKPLASEVQMEAEIGTQQFADSEDWVKVAYRPMAARVFLEKRATSPTMSTLSKATGFQGGVIPGAPNPLIGTLAGGLLGAGLGYGGGYLAEMVLPEEWEKNRLRHTMALLGGAAGAAPGALWMASRHQQGRSPFTTDPSPAAGSLEDLSQLTKSAFDSGTGYNAEWPSIDVPQFHAAIWNDERVSRRLSPATRAAATGLVQGASAMRGGTRFVTPMDMARLTAGMGTGYLSGALIGKALGALTGMPAKTQNRLRNTGVWAGIIANMIPIAFGM